MKKSLKTLLPILLLTGLLFGLSMTASAADSGKRGDWINSPNGWWFQCTDGTYPKNGLYEVNGTAYAFDANGYMVTGWHFFSDYWFYFKDSGAMQTGWFWDKASNAWYYLDPQYGYMYSDGVRYINGTRYAFTPSGQMVTGWYYETWYSESARQQSATGVSSMQTAPLTTAGSGTMLPMPGIIYPTTKCSADCTRSTDIFSTLTAPGAWQPDGRTPIPDSGITLQEPALRILAGSGMKLSIPGITWIRPTLTCIQTELTISMAHSIHLTIPAHGSSKDPDKRNGKSRFQVISRFSHSAFFIL